MAEKKPEYAMKIVKIPGMRFKKEMTVHSFSLPGGRMGRWESMRVPDEPTVLMAGMTDRRTLILLRMFRFPVGEWVYELPGGAAEQGESLTDAVSREFLEETGYLTEKPLHKLCCGWLWDGGTNGSFVVYLAEECKKVKEPELDEVERFAGATVTLQDFGEIVSRIGRREYVYDSIISHALVALRVLGI